jgi:tetratricopeptide (TPR) repeat protein
MSIKELHRKAMELADMADIAKRQGHKDKAMKLYDEAYMLERDAALLAEKDKVGEPCISVLYRSAASLALNCMKYREAEKLIATALSGEPPAEIADELRSLMDNINFYRNASSYVVVLFCEDGVKIKLKVPDGFSDLVKNYWEEHVMDIYHKDSILSEVEEY